MRPFGAARLAGIPGQVHHHHLAARRGQGLATGDQHVRKHLLVERHDERAARAVHLQPPDEALVAARQHLEHTPLVAPLGPALDPGGDAIAVHRVSQRARRDEQILEVLPFAGHEPDAARRRVDGAHDEVRAAGQTEQMPALADQVTAVHERPEMPLERRALLARYAQRADQIARRGRTPHVVTQRAKHLVARPLGA